jgi:hypothetical protein
MAKWVALGYPVSELALPATQVLDEKGITR